VVVSLERMFAPIPAPLVLEENFEPIYVVAIGLVLGPVRRPSAAKVPETLLRHHADHRLTRSMSRGVTRPKIDAARTTRARIEASAIGWTLMT